MQLRRCALMCVIGVLPAGGAVAQLTPDALLRASQAQGGQLPPDTLGGAGMFERIGNDDFITIALAINFDREDWGIGLQVPLRFRLTKNDPDSKNDIFGVIRHEDWQEPGDFLRLLRYVYIGRADKKGPFYIRIGELVGLTVGHGTIVNRYFNGLDVNTWRVGANVAVNVGAFGGEAVFSDIVHPGTDVALAGLRFTARPLELAESDAWPWNRLVVGASLMTDPSAPLTLAMDPANPGSVLLENGRPVAFQRRVVSIVGVDVGLELLDEGPLQITPYVDLNHINNASNGNGLHIGILWQLRFPLVIDTLTADIKTEYRRISGDYISPYFDTAYEIERYQAFPGSMTQMTRLQYLTASSTVASKNGLYFDVFVGLPSLAYIGGEYLNYDGQGNNGTLRLTLTVPALKVIQFSAFYYRFGIGPLSDLIKLDNRSAIVAAAKIPLYSVFTLNFQWWRLWEADPNHAGNYTATDDWSVGVGFSIPL
jgi:hypothetical protein